MPTNLELCRELVAEIGIANGSGPNSVVNQNGELRNVVRWIRDSTLWIDNLWKDWKYLWVEYAGVLGTHTADPALNRFAPAPNTPPGVLVRRWDKTSFWIDKQSASAQPLEFVPWEKFRVLYDVARNVTKTGKPRVITVRPDNTLQTYPIANTTYTLTGEFWRRPVRLALDNDTPLMPAEYHRLIVCRAAIMYANREDAPEIINGMEAEYIDLKEKLESEQLEAFDAERQAGQDLVLEGDIPGM